MLTSSNKSCITVKSKYHLANRDKKRLVKEWKRYPESSGRTRYLHFLFGAKLTPKEAVLAKCAVCNSGYVDGRYDCGEAACPLYQHMPYRGRVRTEWT